MDAFVYLCRMLETRILDKARLGTIDFSRETPTSSIDDDFDETGRVYVVEVDDPDMMQEQMVTRFEVTLKVVAPLDYYLSFVKSLETFLDKKK